MNLEWDREIDPENPNLAVAALPDGEEVYVDFGTGDERGEPRVIGHAVWLCSAAGDPIDQTIVDRLPTHEIAIMVGEALWHERVGTGR